jgi:hypothetical protein
MISFDFGPGIDVFTMGCFGSSGKKDLAVAKDRTCLLNKEPVTERNVSINEGKKKRKKNGSKTCLYAYKKIKSCSHGTVSLYCNFVCHALL